MTGAKRITVNVLATYGRSLFALLVGLYSTRWVLAALGKVDFGLHGLVGGLMLFVVFLNGLMSMAVSRFYSVSVGAAKKELDSSRGLEECRKWFNTAFLLHTIGPILLIIVGYPIGMWAVGNYLDIPDTRVNACRWVWRCACISGLGTMMSVPFQAMYIAKQEIAELTIYSFITTILNACFFFYMADHPADWLVRYSVWTCGVSVVPQLIISVRAFLKYQECRIRREYLLNLYRMREIARFAFARFWTSFSDIILSQGQSILVNKFMGPVFNASMKVGVSVSSQAATLSSSLMQAFWPAIGNKAGEGDLEGVRTMTFRACRFSTMLLMIFAIPLALESHEVLSLWLTIPPEFSSTLCSVVLVCMIIGDMTDGYWMAVMSVGRGVSKYSWWVGWSGISGFFITWLLFFCNFGMWSVCGAFVVCRLITLSMRLYLGSSLVGLPVKHWLRRVFVPIVAAAICGVGAGVVILVVFAPSLSRLIFTTFAVEIALVPCFWFIVFDDEERFYVVEKVKCLLKV